MNFWFILLYKLFCFIIITLMANKQLNQELYTLAKSLLKALLILFKIYGPYLKVLLIALLAYITFVIGRKSIADPLQERINKIQTKLKNRPYYVIQLPNKIKFWQKLKVGLIAIFVASIIAVPLMAYFKVKFMKKMDKLLLVQFGIVGFLAILAVWGYQLWLQKLEKEGRNDNITLNQQLYTATKEMGPKAQALLKSFLCRQRQQQKQKRPAGVCWKQKCKQQRKLAKDKADLLQSLVQTALTFDWCSICKTKLPFQEFLQFEFRRYENVQGKDQSEEVDKKNEYLMGQLARMSAWIRGISPCNCSKLYWMQEIKHIKSFKTAEKQLEGREELLKRRSFIRR